MNRERMICSMIAGALVAGGCAAHRDEPVKSRAESMGTTSDEWIAKPAPPEGVPVYANEVKIGTGPLSFSADTSGRLFLVDGHDDVILFRGELSKGQTFAVDPEARRATVDGKYVFTREINPSHNHRLYFAAE